MQRLLFQIRTERSGYTQGRCVVAEHYRRVFDTIVAPVKGVVLVVAC